MNNLKFQPDSVSSMNVKENNLELSHLIQGVWYEYEIVSIKRIENPKPKLSGWEMTFREDD